MTKTKTSKEFIGLVVWKNGKPFCPDCRCEIQPCHKCGKRTGTEDAIAYTCKACLESGALPCRLCPKCFAETGKTTGAKGE